MKKILVLFFAILFVSGQFLTALTVRNKSPFCFDIIIEANFNRATTAIGTLAPGQCATLDLERPLSDPRVLISRSGQQSYMGYTFKRREIGGYRIPIRLQNTDTLEIRNTCTDAPSSMSNEKDWDEWVNWIMSTEVVIYKGKEGTEIRCN